MAVGREIKTKISSIKKTQKITKAMKLVSVSKLRRAQQRMSRWRPYSHKIRTVIDHIAKSHSEYRHPYLQERPEIKRVGFIIVSTDRGLCGGLNINLFRAVVAQMQAWSKKNIAVDLCVIGRKGKSFFRRIGANIIAEAESLGDNPSITDLVGIVKVMLDNFNDAKLDAIYLASNQFVNTMLQKPHITQLLPIANTEAREEHYWDYLYEPEARELLDVLLVRYIELQVYQGVVENIACEQAARMIAMQNATENAGGIIKELQLVYNKARQAAITQEIAEIVGGAAAI